MTARIIRAVPLALLAVVCVAGRVGAQVCQPAETIGACFNRLNGDPNVRVQAKQAAAKANADETGEKTAAKNSGLQLVDNGSAIKDYLPRFVGALLTPGLSDDPTELGLRLNFPSKPSFPFSSQLELTVTKPEVFDALLEAVPEANRPAVRERLEKDFDDFDDRTYALSFNGEGRSLGRGYRQHAGEFSTLAGEVLAPLETQVLTAAAEWGRFLVGLKNRVPQARQAVAPCDAVASTNPDNVPLSCFDAADRLRIELLIRRLSSSGEVLERESPALLEESGFNLLADLVNNQPQLNGKVHWRRRKDVIGPEEIAGELRFEKGFTNLNALRESCNGAAQITAACLHSYTTRPDVRSSIARQHRLWASAEFSLQPRYRVSLPGDNVQLSQDRSWQFAPSAGYGVYLGGKPGASDRARVDLEAALTANEKGGARQNRFIAKATLSGKLTGAGAAAVSLIYANKPEFLGEVDRKLRANVGLTYKLAQDPE